MKKFIALAGIALLANGAGIAGQSKSGSLQGVWQITAIDVTAPTPRTITLPEPRANLTIVTAKYYSRTEVQSEGPRPIIADVAKATADELRTTWGPFVGEAGTYEVSGSTLTVHPLVSKNPAAMVSGAFIVYTFVLDGNKLTVTQQRSQSGPYPSPATFKLVRVE